MENRQIKKRRIVYACIYIEISKLSSVTNEIRSNGVLSHIKAENIVEHIDYRQVDLCVIQP